MTENGRNNSGLTIQQWIPQLENLGVGEVFITSVDQDGTNKGPDFNLCKEARDLTDIPIIYSGGIRNIEDIQELSKLGFDGASIGSALHYKKINITELKNSLLNSGVYVRTIGEMN
jgi:imidazole glycerol phosphate synthase subunit HisF